MDDKWLRQKACEVIETGSLPNRAPDRTWGGPGSGGDCTVCGKSLPPDESELEIEFFGGPEERGSVTYHLHFRCFDAWQLERLASPANQRGSCSSYDLSAAQDVGNITDGERNNPYDQGRT